MNILKRIGTGIDHTIWLGLLFCLWAVIAYSRSSDPVRDYGVSLHTMIAIYLGAAILTGIILGLLMPFGTTRMRLALIGVPVAWPSAIVIMFFARGAQLSEMKLADLAFSFGIAFISGPIVGTYMRFRGTAKVRSSSRS